MTALVFLVRTILDLYILTFILRFALQWARADSYNPFWQFVVRVTNPLVQPLRQVVPSWRGVELASPLIVLALETLAVVVLANLTGYPLPGWAAILYFALLRALLGIVRLYMFVLFVYVLLSWISPGVEHPLARVLAALCEPVLRPVRRLIPTIGGFDLSPLVVLIGLQAVYIYISAPIPPYVS